MTPVFDSLTFDELKHLADKHPEQLEQYRQDWIDQAIDSSAQNHQRRLRGMQFQIDMQRRKAKNPLGACIQVSKMMHDSLANLYEVITQEQAISVAPAEVAKTMQSVQKQVEQPEQAKVIEFPSVATLLAAK